MLVPIFLKGSIRFAEVVAGDPRGDVMRNVHTNIMAEVVNPALCKKKYTKRFVSFSTFGKSALFLLMK
jgi:hypothetical protein